MLRGRFCSGSFNSHSPRFRPARVISLMFRSTPFFSTLLASRGKLLSLRFATEVGAKNETKKLLRLALKFRQNRTTLSSRKNRGMLRRPRTSSLYQCPVTQPYGRNGFKISNSLSFDFFPLSPSSLFPFFPTFLYRNPSPCRHFNSSSTLSFSSRQLIPSHGSPHTPFANSHTSQFPRGISGLLPLSIQLSEPALSRLSSTFTSLNCKMSLTPHSNRSHPSSALDRPRPQQPVDFDRILDEQAREGLRKAYEAVGKDMIEEAKNVQHCEETLNKRIDRLFDQAKENGDNVHALEEWREKYKEVFMRSNLTAWAFNQISWEIQDIRKQVSAGEKVSHDPVEES